MADDEQRTGRWQRVANADPIQAFRSAIAAVKHAPRDPDARRALQALAADQSAWEPLALLLADEARALVDRPETAAAFYEELVDLYESLDQPLEAIAAMEAVVMRAPDAVEHHDRLAWLYRKVGAWAKAAEAFERVAELARDDRARAALRAAATLYRDNGRFEQAVATYRTIVERRPSDVDAWRALDDVLAKLGRWHEVAEVRGAIAANAVGGVEKAALLRGQARALEQAGDQAAAAELVAQASRHAPDHISGLVDYADVLARAGQGREAAEIIAARVDEAVDRAASTADVAALRLRLVAILEDVCGDRPAAAVVLGDLLAAAPDYLPGLERLASHAAGAGDPRAHAAALARYAAVLPGDASRTAIMVEAARKYRDAGDHREAVRTFEHATEMSPDDVALAQELEDARTGLVVERARAEAIAGDRAGAERRLRGILATRPHDVRAALALADLLVRSDAAVLLRGMVAEAREPDARLVHRYAGLVDDPDEAHHLLHEAHRLDRKSLPITLALGESCFARKLWREAALHLGSLADHAETQRHASGVAAGLVHAAIAETRALRPANATRHYEAAVRIDPTCARAWHALAEVATEKNDLERAAECLEREAEGTTDPDDRLRLYDALGDLALDVHGDAERAERCWSRVATAGHEPALAKLLAVQRRRGAGVERGETCERLAALAADDAARKALVEEAAEAFATGGDLVRARDTASQLVARHSLDVDAVSCASRIAFAAGDLDNAARWLRRALTAWDANSDRGDGDPRRADLWRRLGDAERARSNEQPALLAYQRAVATAPESDGALAARRGIVELAESNGRAEHSSLIALVEAEQDPNDVIAWARDVATSGIFEDARAAFELARALGVELAPADETFLATHRPRPMASDEAYAAQLDEAERRQLVDDDADGILGGILELIGEAIALVCPDAKTALEPADLAGARRVTAASNAATAVLYPQIANALGGPQTLLYANDHGPDLALVLAAPPVVVLGPRLAKLRASSSPTTARKTRESDPTADAELRFRLGRVVELTRARRLFAVGTSPTTFARLVAGLAHAFGGASSTEPAIVAEADRLRAAIPLLLRRKLSDRLADTGTLDAAGYIAACERAADRSGLLACGDIGVAIAAAGGPAAARHLVRFAASPRYHAARRKLRSRAIRSESQ